MKDHYTANFHNLTLTFLFERLGEHTTYLTPHLLAVSMPVPNLTTIKQPTTKDQSRIPGTYPPTLPLELTLTLTQPQPNLRPNPGKGGHVPWNLDWSNKYSMMERLFNSPTLE